MKIISTNKNAKRNYELLDFYEAGIVLTGGEVKSIKQNIAVLDNAFIIIKKNEAFIINLHIPKYEFDKTTTEENRTRKLLLNKKEINNIFENVKLKKLSIVPVDIHLNKKGLIKISFSLAKPYKKWDKREKAKNKEFLIQKNKLKIV